MIKIEVSAADIKKGERANCRKCPVALALKRVFGEEVSVDGMVYFIEQL